MVVLRHYAMDLLVRWLLLWCFLVSWSLVRDCAKFQMPMILNSYVTTGVVFHQTLTHHPRIPMYAYGIATGGKIVFWGIWAGRGFTRRLA